MKGTLLDSWKGFRPFATLDLTASEIGERCGLQFRRSHDDLDSLSESAFSGAAGTVFGLVEHDGSPVRGTELLANERDLQRGALFLVYEALASLRVDRNHIQWTALPSADSARKRRNLVYVVMQRMEKPRVGLVSALTGSLIDEGLEPVTTWHESIEAGLGKYLEVMKECVFVVSVSERADSWAYYELGLAHALEKEIVAVQTSRSEYYETGRDTWWTSARAPQFDHQIVVDERGGETDLRRAFHNLTRRYLVR